MDLLGTLSKVAGGSEGKEGAAALGDLGDLMGSVTKMSKNVLPGQGAAGEAKEDLLDKGIDAYQQYVLKEGPQDNENVVEQAKDKAIAQGIRGQYKSMTGNDFPIKEKS
ncbi:hypothetical protein RQP46_006363 [Phenoliferia psychrophenolica]